MRGQLVLAVLACALLQLACSNSSGSPDGGNSTSGSSGTTGSAASSSGSTGSASSTGGSASSSGSTGASGSTGTPDSGFFTLSSSVASLPAPVQAFSDDSDSGRLWVVTDGPTGDGGFDNGVYVLDQSTLATLARIALPTSLTISGTTYSPFTIGGIIALPGLNKVYFGVLTGPGEVDAIDETSYAVTTVTQLPSNAQSVTAFAYDSVRQLVYVLVAGGYEDPGYIDVIDATHDQLLTTLPLPATGDPATSCAASSSTACFEGQTDLAVDASGQELYLAGFDQNFAPMAATLVLDGGTLQNVLGGQAAGWVSAASGIATFARDGGAMMGVALIDGGAGLQILDPTFDPLNLFDPTTITTVEPRLAACATGNTSVVAYTDGSGAPTFGLFSEGTAVTGKGGARVYFQLRTHECDGRRITSMRAAMLGGSNNACLYIVVRCTADDGSTLIVSGDTNYCCPPN